MEIVFFYSSNSSKYWLFWTYKIKIKKNMQLCHQPGQSDQIELDHWQCQFCVSFASDSQWTVSVRSIWGWEQVLQDSVWQQLFDYELWDTHTEY